MNLGYSWSIEGAACTYLSHLPTKRRRRLERAIEHLAAHPFLPSAFTVRDALGAVHDWVEREAHLIGYHVDHAVRRVRITDIQPLS